MISGASFDMAPRSQGQMTGAQGQGAMYMGMNGDNYPGGNTAQVKLHPCKEKIPPKIIVYSQSI